MQIDISIKLNHPDVATNTIKYGRIDNTSTPTFYSITGVPNNTFKNITVDNGQYEIQGIPEYPDARTCTPTTQDTPACPLMVAVNAVQVGSNIEVTYTALGSVPQVMVIVNFPNGATFQQVYSNGNAIVVPIPSGVTGNATVYMQSICDPDTGFYGALSAPVTVVLGGTNVRMTSTGIGVIITQTIGIAGFTMPNSLGVGGTITGNHDAFTGGISLVFTGTPTLTTQASLSVNGTLQECVQLPNTNGGAIAFASSTYYLADEIEISIGTGGC